MRDQLRDLIAENEGKRRNGPASDGRGWYRTEADRVECFSIAEAVMELFPDVQAAEVYQRNGWTLPADTFPQFRDATHRYFLARTAPVPIAPEETP